MKDKINKSIFILNETFSRYKNPAVMWSTGKDSTAMLYLIMNSRPDNKIPIPVIHIDTGKKFKEIYEFKDMLIKKWNLNVITAKSEDVDTVSPDTNSHFECCSRLKTYVLKDVVKEHGFDALIMSIRRDEHAMRNIERTFSPRDKDMKWNVGKKKHGGDSPFESLQQPEVWQLYQTDFGEDCSHVRVHPMLHWDEIDVWKYIKENNIEMNPLYFSKKGMRYRSLGCECCTTPVKSDAANIDEIIEELKTTKVKERSGRSQDKESDSVMQRLRAMGYM